MHKSAALLIIGNEILSGRTRDANAWLAAQQLFARGCRLVEIAVVADDRQAIIHAIQRLRHQVDAIITSGGIGPTHDDITMDCIAEAMAVELVEYHEVIEQMRRRYGDEQLNSGRRRMAHLPAGSEMIVCEKSIAPGAHIENIYVLAGVPEIFASQLESILTDFGDLLFLREEIPVELPESAFSTTLATIQEQHPDVEIGSYPSHCGVAPKGKICLTSRSESALQTAKAAVLQILEKL